ncbi:MAG: serine hydrolase [Bacteroidota bacterium]
MKNLFASLLFTAIILLGTPIISLGQSVEEAYDALLIELFPTDQPGGVALVAKKGEIIYHKAFGKAHLELDVDMKSDNVFRIGSVTKQFTACAILKLMEAGKLKLDDPITNFIEDYPTHGHTITIEHLLTHTSGIRSYTDMGKWDSEIRKQDFTPEEMVDYFKNEPMDFAPGEQWRYNNSGYFLLGHIIELLSGQSYGEYLTENFFEPLGMKHTSYGNTSRIVPKRVAGYSPSERGLVNAPFLSMTQPYAAGSILSNVEDLHTWYEALMDYKVVSRESLEKAHTSYILNNGRETGYGYGWILGEIQGSPQVWHGGGINGYLTATNYLPQEDVFVAVLSNCNCHSPTQVAIKMAAMAIGKPYIFEKIELDTSEIAAYQAVYASEDFGKLYVEATEGALTIMRSAGSKQTWEPYGKDKFFREGGLSTLQFHRNSEGKIDSVSLGVTVGPDNGWKRTHEALPTASPVIALSPKELTKYEGKYELAPEFILHIFQEEGILYAQATGQGRFEIKSYEPHKFFTEVVDAKIHFHVNDAEEVSGLTLVQGGENEAKRIE